MLRWFSVSLVSCCFFVFSRLGVFKEFKVFLAKRGCFAFLVIRSSSSDCIGLFKFVMEIVPNCCEKNVRLFS